MAQPRIAGLVRPPGREPDPNANLGSTLARIWITDRESEANAPWAG